MTTGTNKPNAAAAEQISATAEQLSTARAEGRAEGKAEGVKEGAAAERGRVKSILSHAEAAGRTELAQHLAFETDMAADAATSLLAKSPKSSAGPAATPLAAAMAAQGTPGVRSEEPAASVTESPKVDTAAIYAARRAAR